MRNEFSGHRIDERVLITMISLIVVSLMILAFRFKSVEPCMEVNIAVKAANYYKGSLISFRAEANKGRNYEWDFGDGNRYESIVPSVQHSFKTPGTYTVSVIVNGHCEGFDTVIIQGRPVFKPIYSRPTFISPDTVLVNKPVTFIDTSADATSWEWRFGESDIVDGRTQRVSYIFKTPGDKEIYLEINGRSDRASTRTIYVKDVPPLVKVDNERISRQARVERVPLVKDKPTGSPLGDRQAEGSTIPQAPPPRVYPDIQADEMIMLLQQVVTGEKKAEDFSKYFCNDENIPVTYNGKPMKFNQMCNALRKFKKLKNIHTPEVQLEKNASSNCIRTMILKVEEKSAFRKLFGG